MTDPVPVTDTVPRAGAGPPAEPSRRRIAVEVLLYSLLVLAAGAAFVAFRVRRIGTRVLDHDPRAAVRETRGTGGEAR